MRSASLTTITGVVCLSFLTVSAWAQVGNTVQTKENLDLPYDAIGDEEEEEDAPEIIEFYGQQFEGDGYAFAIDHSGSMNDSGELDIAKREVTRNISEFSSRVQFGVVFFDADVKKFPASGQPADANPSQKQAAIGWTQGIGRGSGSCCQQGLVAALEIANKMSTQRRTIIYVGDGGGTCRGANEAEYLNQTLTIIAARNYNRAQINAIGVLNVGTTQRDFLQKLARNNNGTYTEIGRGG